MEVDIEQTQTNYQKQQQLPQQDIVQLQPETVQIPLIQNQSNLMQSKVILDDQRPITKANNFDQLPIRGGKKFEFSEYPQQGEIVKKPVPKKNQKKQTKIQVKAQITQVEAPNQSTQTTSGKLQIQPTQTKKLQDQRPIGGNKANTFDEQPIGGGNKFTMSEFPQEQNIAAKPAAKKNLTKKAAKVPVKVQPADNQQVPIQSNKKTQNYNKVQPKSNKSIEDQRPIGKGTGFDEQPIGGGNKFQMSEYPDENDASKKPAVKKKDTKKVAKKPFNNQNVPIQSMKKIVTQEQVLSKTSTVPLDELPVGGNNKGSQFDQKPLASNKNAFTMSEFPQGQQQAPSQQTQYPMNQKLKSKAAKLRLAGMQDLLKLLEEDPQNSDISQVDIKALVKETTPANLEKGLQVLKMWVQKGKKWGDQEIKNAIQNGMTKVNTKKWTIQILDFMYQENPNTVQASILLGMKGKIAKNVAYYLTMISQLLAIYGIKKMKYLKPYIPQIVKLLNEKKDIPIKTQGTLIHKQSYKWLSKDVISPMLGQLKQGIKKQIDTFWQSYDQTLTMKAPKAQQQVDDGNKGKKKKVDAYDLSEAVDVFKKYNQKCTEGVIAAAKWSQKTKMLQEFVKACSVPKLANTDFRHISQMIKRLINDSNFNVVLWDMKVLAIMSKGLRRHFQYVVKNVFSHVLGKFRDKKTQMIDQTFSTLNDFMYSISIEEVLDDVKQGLQDKAPNMKVNVVNWIGKFVQIKMEEKGQIPQKALDAIRALFPIYQKLLNDGNVQVRDCTARNVFKMKMSIGDEFFAPLQSKMNKNLASKIVDTKSSKIKQPSRVQKSVESEMGKSQSNLKKSQNKKQQVQKSMIKTQIFPKKEQKKALQPQLKLQRFQQPSVDDCCTKLLEYGFPEQQLKNIKAAGAKQRTGVFNILKADSYDLLTVFIIIRQLFKDWKQVNLIMNKQLVAYIQEKSTQIDKPEFVVLIPFLTEKIGDTKFAQTIFKIIQNVCEKVPSVFVVGYFIQKIKQQDWKKPKLNGDVCTCIGRIMDTVSASNVPLRQVILYANDCFKNQFAKKSGLQLLKKIYSHIGDQIKVYLQAQTYSLVQTEFKKIKTLSQDEKLPKIQFSGQAKKSIKSTVNLLQGKPKVDISQQVLALLPKMNDATNWQNRKQSAQSIIALVNDNFSRVSISCMSDLMHSLKSRINDSNKNLPKIFMQLTGVLFPILSDRDVKMFAKMFIVVLADALSDKMEANKKQAVITLGKIGDVIGREQLLTTLAVYLDSDKESRNQIIHIMLANEQHLAKTDMKEFPKGITNCLCDKNKDIRNLAEKLFEKVYEKIGIQTFRSIAKNQKPATCKDLNLIYDKYQKNSHQVSQSYISKPNSPSKESKIFDSRKLPPSVSAKKRSLQKNSKNYQSTLQLQVQQNQLMMNTNSSRIKTNLSQNPQYLSNTQIKQTPSSVSTLVQGDEWFAQLKFLTQFRVDRQDNKPWALDQLKQDEEDSLKNQINMLFKPELTRKMFSCNPKRLGQAVLLIIKLCKEVTFQNHFREVYDLILKWTLLRLWGGSPSLLTIVQCFPPVLSILQKKNMVLNDSDVQLFIAVIRQYFISSYMIEYKVSDSLHVIIRSLVSLSSGEKVVKKILRQFNVELTIIHRHLKKEINAYYRDGLSKLLKRHLIDFIGKEQLLEDVSKIKQLRSDPEFVDILYKKFHQSILNSFGFRNYVQHVNPSPTPSLPLPSSNYSQSQIMNNTSGLPRRERSISNQKRQKSEQKQPQRPTNNSRVSINIEQVSNIMKQKANPSSNQPSSIKIAQQHVPYSMQRNRPSCPYMQAYLSTDINLSPYPAPHPISPLGKNLLKLLPPSEQTIRFFSQLFSEHGEKIASELTTHAKIIFGSILKSVMEMLENRQQYTPDKIVNQLNLLQHCIKCKYVIKNIDQLLYTAIVFALRQLVYQDQNKNLIHQGLLNRGIQYKIENFIKVINGVMLRILQNGNPQLVVNTLIHIHNQYMKKTQKSIKTIYLIMKCTSRVAQNYTQQMKLQGVTQFFLVINQYLAIAPPQTSLQTFLLPTRDKPKPQQNFLYSIKSILLQLGKVLSTDIWDLYDKAMERSTYQDNYVKEYLLSLKIKYQEKREIETRDNQEIKKISQLLSKNKTYQLGIMQLKKYTQMNLNFSPIDYFTSLGYDQKFIVMVLNSLQGKQRRTPRKDNKEGSTYAKSKSPINNNPNLANQQQNIQQKIKKLKQKFQQVQPDDRQVPYDQISQRKIAQSKNERSQKQQRAVQIKRRIDQMKNRLNQNFDKPR